MKNFLPLIIASLAAMNAFAQSSIRGSLTDGSDRPLVGVNVVIGDAYPMGTITDESGKFKYDRLPSAIRLRASHVGHEPIDTLLKLVDGVNMIQMQMPRTAYLMPEAEVTAVRATDRMPIAQSTLRREELEKINTGVDLPLLLDLQPSVVTTTDGGTGIGYTGMRIRGTDATRINITLNGVPFNDAESQGTFFVDLPDFASSVEDIQIQRGVGTSTNGSGAFGASINLRTAPVSGEPFGEVSVFGGSYNTQRYSARFGTGLSKNGFSLDGRLSSITSDGYVDRASADLKSYFLQGAWRGEKRSLRFITFRGKEVTYQAWAGVDPAVLDTNRTYNPYAYENQVDDYGQTHYQLLFDQRLGENATLNITGFRVDGAGFFESFERDADLGFFGIGQQVIGNDTIASSDLIQRRWLDNTLLGVNASVQLKHGKAQWIIGGSYSSYTGDHFGEVIWSQFAGNSMIRQRYYENDARKTDGNAFAKVTYALGNELDLFGDLQVRQVDHEFLGFDEDLENLTQKASFTFFNPKAGVNWRPSASQRAYASIAIANREPNRGDLLETTPQSRPTSEQLIDYEIGWQRRTGTLSTGINLYYMDYTDQLVLTGELNDVGAALRTNVADSYRAGIELTWSAMITKAFTWKGNATFSQNRIPNFSEFVDDWDTGEQQRLEYRETDLAFSPAIIAASELGYRVWNNERKGIAEIAFVTKYVGEQFLDNSGSSERMLKAYLVNDLRANISLKEIAGLKRVAFNLTLRNLFSELYESNGWSYSYFSGGQREELIGLYPQAPLNVMGGVVLGF